MYAQFTYHIIRPYPMYKIVKYTVYRLILLWLEVQRQSSMLLVYEWICLNPQEQRFQDRFGDCVLELLTVHLQLITELNYLILQVLMHSRSKLVLVKSPWGTNY